MKKRLLLCFSFAIFMLFSFIRCSQETLDVEDHLGTFTKEARLYFEQNATDIQTVRIGNQKESLSRSMALSSRVITPNWQEGQSVKRGAISSLEVPLTGDVYVKSLYSRVQDGIRQRSLANVQMKLIIQKHDELEEMRSFVVTIIMDRRYEIMHAQSLRTFSFVNPKEFSGLMVVSDLEGNYLDAFQFTDGKQQRVALARTSGMEEKDIDPASVVSTFTLMDGNRAGVYTRSGESGGWEPVPPGEIPEVVVRYCSQCHLPVEQCRGHSVTPPPVNPPQWYCPLCGSFVCSGNCQSGGSGGGGSVPDKVSPQGDLSKKVFSGKSQLTPEQWKKVEDALKRMNNDCMGGKLVKALNGANITISQNRNMGDSGKYTHATKELEIKDFSESKDNESVERTLLHELLHSKQSHDNNKKLNLEIEVHFAVYRYAMRNGGIPISGVKYLHMSELDYIMDPQYNTNDSNFNSIYNDIVSDFRKINTYENYPEIESARNFNTVKDLSVDCND